MASGNSWEWKEKRPDPFLPQESQRTTASQPDPEQHRINKVSVMPCRGCSTQGQPRRDSQVPPGMGGKLLQAFLASAARSSRAKAGHLFPSGSSPINCSLEQSSFSRCTGQTRVWRLPAFPDCHQHRARPRGGHFSFTLVPQRRTDLSFLRLRWECPAEIPPQPSRPCLTFARKAVPKLPVPRAAPAPAAPPGAPTGMTHPDRIATLLFA